LVYNTNMNEEAFLEQFYEQAVLPRYADAVDLQNITWKDHGKVGLDAWAHYFDDQDGREYILLYEDSPGGAPFDDGLSHDVVEVGGQLSHRFGFEGDVRLVPNITGYFTLYREK